MWVKSLGPTLHGKQDGDGDRACIAEAMLNWEAPRLIRCIRGTGCSRASFEPRSYASRRKLRETEIEAWKQVRDVDPILKDAAVSVLHGQDYWWGKVVHA